MYLVDNSEKRNLDTYTIKNLNIPSLLLMENAAQRVFDLIDSLNEDCKNILILTGKGNNGGDGFALGRILNLNNYNADIYMVYEPESKDAIKNFKISKKYELNIFNKSNEPDYKKYNIIVDAVFGTGFHGELDEKIQKLFYKCNKEKNIQIAIDIPSGVEGSSGKISKNPFCADYTVTFEYPLVGHFIQPGKKYCGKLLVKSIGLIKPAKMEFSKSVILKQDIDIKELPVDIHKYSRGIVTVIGGKKEYSGASILASYSALKGGAGYVKLKSVSKNRFENHFPEIVLEYFDNYNRIKLTKKEQKGVLIVGPGLGREKIKIEFLKNLFTNFKNLKIILDADALFYFDKFYKKEVHDVIITPHIGEFANLTGLKVSEIKDDIIKIGKKFAKNKKCTLVLKSENTIIFSKDGNIYINGLGNQYMATLGMGDVLTGVIAGFWSQKGYNAILSAKNGVLVHSSAADNFSNNGLHNFTAKEIADNIKI